MTRAKPIDLSTLVRVYVEVALTGCLAVIRVPNPRPEDKLAFLMFQRAWPIGHAVCQFVGPERAA